jgi:hypothetical protein
MFADREEVGEAQEGQGKGPSSKGEGNITFLNQLLNDSFRRFPLIGFTYMGVIGGHFMRRSCEISQLEVYSSFCMRYIIHRCSCHLCTGGN